MPAELLLQPATTTSTSKILWRLQYLPDCRNLGRPNGKYLNLSPTQLKLSKGTFGREKGTQIGLMAFLSFVLGMQELTML